VAPLLGIEIDVHDHEAVEADGGARRPGVGRVDVLSRMLAAVPAYGYQGKHPRPDALTASCLDEPVRHRLFVQCGRPVHDAAALSR
jgi:hypothetical protein